MSEDPVKICSRERVKRANESGEWEVSDCKERTGTTVASKTRTNRERFARACSVRRSRYRSADRLQHSIEGTSAFDCFLGQSIVYAVVLLSALDDSVFGEYAEVTADRLIIEIEGFRDPTRVSRSLVEQPDHSHPVRPATRSGEHVPEVGFHTRFDHWRERIYSVAKRFYM